MALSFFTPIIFTLPSSSSICIRPEPGYGESICHHLPSLATTGMTKEKETEKRDGQQFSRASHDFMATEYASHSVVAGIIFYSYIYLIYGATYLISVLCLFIHALNGFLRFQIVSLPLVCFIFYIIELYRITITIFLILT